MNIKLEQHRFCIRDTSIVALITLPAYDYIKDKKEISSALLINKGDCPSNLKLCIGDLNDKDESTRVCHVIRPKRVDQGVPEVEYL